MEDNALNMEIAKAILCEHGLEVDGAENGQEAYERFTSSAPGTYEAVLMDLQMPVMDGCTAARMIRASSHPQAPNHSHYCPDCQCLCRGCGKGIDQRNELPHSKTH